jgi:hypothetical protein
VSGLQRNPQHQDGSLTIRTAFNKHDTFNTMLALNALQAMGVAKVSPARDSIAALPTKVNQMPPRADAYVARLLAKLREDLGVK